MLEDKVDDTSGKLLPPNLTTLNVNLLGVIYTAKCAVHYFGKMGGRPCQLVLTGSAAWYALNIRLHELLAKIHVAFLTQRHYMFIV